MHFNAIFLVAFRDITLVGGTKPGINRSVEDNMPLLSRSTALQRSQSSRGAWDSVKQSTTPSSLMRLASFICHAQVELDEAIKSLSVVAAAPELYPALVDAGAVTSLLGLLTHENTVGSECKNKV